VTTDDLDSKSSFRLVRGAEKQRPSAILDDVSALLCFIDGHVFPPLDTLAAERKSFVAEIHSAVFQAVLDNVILTAMPSSLPAISKWLELVHRALDIEEKHSADESRAIIKPFFETAAGEAWANQRRRRIAEEARKLIVGGWGGWEAKEAEREKEVTVVVEVEVTDEDVPAEQNGDSQDAFGWGFEDDASKQTSTSEAPMIAPSRTSETADDSTELDDGWGFDDSAKAGPSSPRIPTKTSNGHPTQTEEVEGDGWDFEDAAVPPIPEPPKPVLAKPAREAKRLGKKVAKVKATAEDDPWGSGSESIASSGVLQPPQPAKTESQDDGWGWEEPQQKSVVSDIPEKRPSPVRPKRKELKETKKTIHEKFLISRACDKLVDMAERVLREARDLESAS